jgi:hypothetical protein
MRAFALAALLWIAPAASAMLVAGTSFPDSIVMTQGGPELVLNGAGERRILLLGIYAIGLYLPARASSLEEAIAQKGPKRLHIVMLRNGISSKQVHDHVIARMEDGTQPAEMAQMRSRLDDLERIIESERVIDRGGTISLDLIPRQGTVIVVNGGVRGKPIPGEDFYNALLRIWLGDKAKSLTLRDRLLGKT